MWVADDAFSMDTEMVTYMKVRAPMIAESLFIPLNSADFFNRRLRRYDLIFHGTLSAEPGDASVRIVEHVLTLFAAWW
jgi:hypothetical protein